MARMPPQRCSMTACSSSVAPLESGGFWRPTPSARSAHHIVVVMVDRSAVYVNRIVNRSLLRARTATFGGHLVNLVDAVVDDDVDEILADCFGRLGRIARDAV